MTKDILKGITNITYNYLNLPAQINFGNDRKISYLYSAAGTKISTEVKTGTAVQDGTYTTLGSMVYDQNGDLSYILTDKGCAVPRADGESKSILIPKSFDDKVKATVIGGSFNTMANYSSMWSLAVKYPVIQVPIYTGVYTSGSIFSSTVNKKD